MLSGTSWPGRPARSFGDQELGIAEFHGPERDFDARGRPGGHGANVMSLDGDAGAIGEFTLEFFAGFERLGLLNLLERV